MKVRGNRGWRFGSEAENSAGVHMKIRRWKGGDGPRDEKAPRPAPAIKPTSRPRFLGRKENEEAAQRIDDQRARLRAEKAHGGPE